MGTILYTSPFGKIFVSANEGKITELYFKGGVTTPSSLGETKIKTAEDSAVLEKVKHELDLYFAGKLKEFTVPVNPAGTAFRKTVWQALQAIPYGKTVSYKELAVQIGNPKAVRAVGGANHNNPISIIIPCHRVIGANGKLVGYGGGLGVKEFLLKLESV